MTTPQNTPQMLDIDTVLAELDPLGRALFDAAMERARAKQFAARVSQLEQELAATRRDRPTAPAFDAEPVNGRVIPANA